MDRFKPWLETMYFYCSSELYDLDRLKSYIAGNPAQREFIQDRFRQILDKRPFTAADWENALYRFLFAYGAFPEWD